MTATRFPLMNLERAEVISWPSRHEHTATPLTLFLRRAMSQVAASVATKGMSTDATALWSAVPERPVACPQ